MKCPRHVAIENSVEIRSRALALTSDTVFEGNVATALSHLVHLCRDCNSSLSIVMSVIWQRLGQTKAALWRHQLLALHLLKTLLLHGVSYKGQLHLLIIYNRWFSTFLSTRLQPITAIAEGVDGIEKVYYLRTFSNAKSASAIKEVRQTADQVYGKIYRLSTLCTTDQN